MTAPSGLTVRDLAVSYGSRTVLEHVDLELPAGEVTVIIGGNGSGKSTLLRTAARLIRPDSGHIQLDGREIHNLPTRQLAQRLGLLPQSPIAPEGISVSDLVARGRTPHHGPFGRWTRQDDDIVADALEAMGAFDLADRDIDELSGGQRQRVWIAMALAQRTDILLLDEPTTYLDLVHQIDVLELLRELNRDRHTTIIMVLHDLNLAARYADHLVAVRAGEIYTSGTPAEVFTAQMLRDVFDLECHLTTDPFTGRPHLIPTARATTASSAG